MDDYNSRLSHGTNVEVMTLYLATITIHPYVGRYPVIEGKLIN